MDLKRDTRRGGVDWIHVVQDRDLRRVLVNMVINFHVPYNVGKFFSGQVTGSLLKDSAPWS
jgi:hypothetical protein